MLALHVSSPYLNDAFTDSRKKQLLTLKEISRFSPPQMSMPASYWPISLKYFLLIANNPPAIVGDLGGGVGVLSLAHMTSPLRSPGLRRPT